MNPEVLPTVVLAVAAERSLDRTVPQIEGLLAQPGVALARVWLMAPGDICETCRLRAECPDRAQCLHLAARAGASLSLRNDWSRVDGGSRRFPLGVRRASKVLFAVQIVFVLLVCVFIPLEAAAQAPRQAPAASTETYESADIDDDGNLRILTSDRRTIIVPKGGSPKAGESFGRQTAFGQPVLSDDRRAVGAQAMFENCCTSYDIPLQLVIHSGGQTHRFEGGLAIFDWHFVDGGRRVAFSQQTVHFACSVHWELRDIASEQLLATADIPRACGQGPDPPKGEVPTWVTGTVSGFE